MWTTGHITIHLQDLIFPMSSKAQWDKQLWQDSIADVMQVLIFWGSDVTFQMFIFPRFYSQTAGCLMLGIPILGDIMPHLFLGFWRKTGLSKKPYRVPDSYYLVTSPSTTVRKPVTNYTPENQDTTGWFSRFHVTFYNTPSNQGEKFTATHWSPLFLSSFLLSPWQLPQSNTPFSLANQLRLRPWELKVQSRFLRTRTKTPAEGMA